MPNTSTIHSAISTEHRFALAHSHVANM